MADTMLETLTNWVRADADLVGPLVRCAENIASEQQDARDDFPCIYIYEAESRHDPFFDKTGYEHRMVDFVIVTDGEDIEAKERINTIEQEIYHYLLLHPQFPVTNYDRGHIFNKSRGIPQIVELEGRTLAMLTPRYALAGCYEPPQS